MATQKCSCNERDCTPQSGEVHEVKARFSVNPGHYYASAYQPVLAEEQVVRVDTTDLDSVDVGAVAAQVRALVGLS